MAGGVHGFDPERLRAAQGKAGLSVRQLAAALGMTPAVVFTWRSGRARPYPRHLVRLAVALGCKTTYLAPLPDPPRLRHYRERAGLTQAELAQQLEVSPVAVSRVELGLVWPDDPAPWADAYGISLRTFSRVWRATSVQRTDR